MISDNRKIGMGLTTSGAIFLFLGVLFFFDKALLALGNFLFLTGITLLIGLQRTMKFFLRKGKVRGSVCFIGGMLLVLLGWCVIGMLIEVFGIINLFSNFFPFVLLTLRQLPIIGPILQLPVVSHVLNRLVGAVLPSHYDKQSS